MDKVICCPSPRMHAYIASANQQNCNLFHTFTFGVLAHIAAGDVHLKQHNSNGNGNSFGMNIITRSHPQCRLYQFSVVDIEGKANEDWSQANWSEVLGVVYWSGGFWMAKVLSFLKFVHVVESYEIMVDLMVEFNGHVNGKWYRYRIARLYGWIDLCVVSQAGVAS